jgi:HAD superfamily hydrolase (TIGR01509 family)
MPLDSPLTIVLDAMGVIYRVGDDVGELLIPFIFREGGIDDVRQIEQLYLQASLGAISSREFWNRVGLGEEVEDRYLRALELSGGIVEFLEAMRERGARLACLSNDVGQWSVKTRHRFGLEDYIRTWVISGDVHCRKPDTRIYRILLDTLDCPAESVIFVDDREKNLVPARSCGIRCIRFADRLSTEEPDASPVARGFRDVARLIDRLGRGARDQPGGEAG